MHRCAQIGVLATNIIYAVLMVITLAFFSEVFLIFVIMPFFATRQAINSIVDHMSRVSLYMAIYYPYLLFALVLIKQRWNRKRGKHADAQK